MLLKHPDINVHVIDGDGDSALSLAIERGLGRTLMKLLEVMSDDGVAAAHAIAAKKGHGAALALIAMVLRWRARRAWISLCTRQNTFILTL